MSYQLVFKVGITCQSCVSTVNAALTALNFEELGLSNQRIDLTQKKLFLDFDPLQTDTKLEQAITAIKESIIEFGFSCELESSADLDRQVEQSHRDDKAIDQDVLVENNKHNSPISLLDSNNNNKSSYHWWLGGVGLTTGLGLMLLTFFTGGLTLPLMLTLGLSSTILTAILGYRSFVNAYTHALYSRTMTMDTLFTISTITVLALSIGSFFIPGLPMMFEAGLMIFGFRHIGLGIEEALNHKTGVQQNFTDRLPETVTLQNGKTIRTRDIQPGDLLLLKNGDVLPVDGFFIDTNPTISNVIKTGSDRHFPYQSNQIINAGAIIDDEAHDYLFKSQTTVAGSYLAKLDSLLLSAQQNKAPIEYYTDKLLNYFVPGVLIVAILTGLIVGIWFSPIVAIQCAASVLVMACPCTLGMIVPMTMKIGMQKGLNHGVAFKSREAIERANNIDQIVFDLNGTLTQGVPEVQECKLNARVPEQLIWEVVLFLENNAKHPIGISLSKYASDQLKTKATDKFSNIEVSELRNGRKATISIIEQEHTFCIGNAQCMRDNGISVKENTQEPIIYLADNNKIIAQFTVIDPLRKGAVETIQYLKSTGKSVFLLTGSDKETAEFYGKLLNIAPENQFANQSPENKLKQIKSLQEHGYVAMIGDGGNDAIALKQSYLGIIRQSHMSDDLTAQQAQIVINDQSILPVGHIFQIADRTMSTLKQNLYFSFAYNAAALLLTGGLLTAIGFAMNPALGAGLMVLQTSLILLNTYRLTTQNIVIPTPRPTVEKTSLATLSPLKRSPVYEPNSPTLQVNEAICDISSDKEENHCRCLQRTEITTTDASPVKQL